MASVGFKTNVRRLQKSLQNIRKVPRMLSKLIAKEISDDLQETFSSESNPYGTSWKLRKVDRLWPILKRTGDLESSRKVTVKSDGEVVIEYDESYAKYHQSGTKKMAQRLLVPTTARGIPKRWKDALKKAFKKTLSELFP